MIRTRLQGDTPFFPNMLNNGQVEVCLKEDVDKEIRLHWEEIEQTRAENERLKAKLESVQASAYADSVDAGMRERRLRRALWLARAGRASDKVELFWLARKSTQLLDIDGKKIIIANAKGWWRQLKATEWLLIWQKAERKCRDKAEEYK